MTEVEKEWLLTIRAAELVFRRGNVIDIQVYTPSRFVAKIDFSQGVVGSQATCGIGMGAYKMLEMPESFPWLSTQWPTLVTPYLKKRTAITGYLLNGMPKVVYPTKGGLGELCTLENIFTLLVKRRKNGPLA